MNTKDSKKKRANLLYTLLAVVAYSFPIWFIIGIVPWAYMVEFDTELWWKLVWFQIGGLIGIIGSGIAVIKRVAAKKSGGKLPTNLNTRTKL